MADIKTHLRELSVAVTVGLLVNEISFTVDKLYNIKYFFETAKRIIKNDISSAEIFESGEFDPDLCEIIKNGYNLGEKIYNSKEFYINKDSVILWKGNDTQKEDPIDIVIGQYRFSLKEESFILENMGLYKLLNCFTNSAYKTRHIFKDYALIEYQNWFSIAWSEMIKIVNAMGGIWHLNNKQKRKEAIIEISNNNVVLKYYDNEELKAKSKLPLICTLEIFEKKTSSKTREKVFSKFINSNLYNNIEYNKAKKVCAVTATTNLANELTKNLNYTAGLPRFLRIHTFDYYYAKTTSTELVIYKVPSLANFESNIVIDSIVPSVPDKQANILTTIRNIKTDKTLVLRNECRFSHGQFNGTPEAKMYYESGGSLLTIYEPI